MSVNVLNPLEARRSQHGGGGASAVLANYAAQLRALPEKELLVAAVAASTAGLSLGPHQSQPPMTTGGSVVPGAAAPAGLGAWLWLRPGAGFPALSFDPSLNRFVDASAGPAMIAASLVMAAAWGTVAIVFVGPTWAGVMVLATAKALLAVLLGELADALRVEFAESLRLLSAPEVDAEVGGDEISVSGDDQQRQLQWRLRRAASSKWWRLCRSATAIWMAEVRRSS